MATGGGGGRGGGEGDNRLNCAVCLEQYRRPKLLPCFHTFCQGCIQALVGSSLSFPCPACRTTVLLPPGGVPALQTNFYIEQDLDMDSIPRTRLCDVCTQDTEASHSCLQCRQRYCTPCRKVHDSIPLCRGHTLACLQSHGPEGEAKGGEGGCQGRAEELCPKHRQAVVLHCVPCRANICMQCKLTAHDGHPTEDLQDMGSKVKARLQQRLQVLSQQATRVQGVISEVQNRRDGLAALQSTTEEGVRERATKARQLVDECQENTLSGLRIFNQDLLQSLSADEERLQHQHAALTAQTEHITRVLREDHDKDIVDLEAELNQAVFDEGQVMQTWRSLQLGTAPYECEHNALAINTAQLQEFVGVLRRSVPKTPAPGRDASGAVASEAGQTGGPAESDAVPRPAGQSVTVKELVYSRNPKSRVTAICSTSEKRAWIKYSPCGLGDDMALFGGQGLVRRPEHVLRGAALITMFSDTTVGFDNSMDWFGKEYLQVIEPAWVGPNGLTGKCIRKQFSHVFSVAKTYKQFLYMSCDACKAECSLIYLKSLHSDWRKTVIGHGMQGHLRDVCRCERYFVFGYGSSANLYVKSPSNLEKISTYCPDPNKRILDACFFPVNGREMLVVVVAGDNRVHVVDHTDGCCFVQYLDTGHLTLESPQLLATDQETMLWVACDRGKVMMMEVSTAL